MQLLIQRTRNRRVAEERAESAVRSWRITMNKWIAMGAAAALMMGVSVASAQMKNSPNAGTPGAGSAGQDQSGATAAGSAQTPGQAKTKDKPPSVTTGTAPKAGAPKAPSISDKNSIHQSTGDRDSRGLPKQK
jgi:hypothetical protein